MKIEKHTAEGAVVLSVDGDVKVGKSARLLDQTLEQVLAQDQGDVVIDLSQVDFMDSTGISQLVGYLKRLGKARRKLILVNPSKRIRRLLEMVHLTDHIPVYDTLQEALQGEG